MTDSSFVASPQYSDIHSNLSFDTIEDGRGEDLTDTLFIREKRQRFFEKPNNENTQYLDTDAVLLGLAHHKIKLSDKTTETINDTHKKLTKIPSGATELLLNSSVKAARQEIKSLRAENKRLAHVNEKLEDSMSEKEVAVEKLAKKAVKFKSMYEKQFQEIEMLRLQNELYKQIATVSLANRRSADDDSLTDSTQDSSAATAQYQDAKLANDTLHNSQRRNKLAKELNQLNQDPNLQLVDMLRTDVTRNSTTKRPSSSDDLRAYLVSSKPSILTRLKLLNGCEVCTEN